MKSVQQELDNATAKAFANRATIKCYKTCIAKPGPSLNASEETCLSHCLDRYVEAFNITKQTFLDRLAKERSGAFSGLGLS